MTDQESIRREIEFITRGGKYNPREQFDLLDKAVIKIKEEQRKMERLYEGTLKSIEQTIQATRLTRMEKDTLLEMYRGIIRGIETETSCEETTYKAIEGMHAVIHFLKEQCKITVGTASGLRNLTQTIYEKWDSHLTKRAKDGHPLQQYTTRKPIPKKIINNDPVTIVFWTDGTKTIVKRGAEEKNSPYAAFCAVLAKKIYGNNTKVNRLVSETEIVKKEKKAAKAEERGNG